MAYLRILVLAAVVIGTTSIGAVAQEPARFDALVFSKTTGFRHSSIDEATADSDIGVAHHLLDAVERSHRNAERLRQVTASPGDHLAGPGRGDDQPTARLEIGISVLDQRGITVLDDACEATLAGPGRRAGETHRATVTLPGVLAALAGVGLESLQPPHDLVQRHASARRGCSGGQGVAHGGHGLIAENKRRLFCLSMFWHFLDVVWIGVFGSFAGLLLTGSAYVIFAFAGSVLVLLLSRLVQGAGGGTIVGLSLPLGPAARTVPASPLEEAVNS